MNALLRTVRSGLIALTALVTAGHGIASASTAAERVVRDVRIEGAQRLEPNTVLYYTALKVGAPYSEVAVRDDFRRLWETGFFEDLRVEIDDVTAGVAIIWYVVERPVLAAIKYDGNEGIPSEDITTHLKDRGIEFREGAPFSLGQLERARVLIEELFREKGYRFVAVKNEISDDPETGKSVVVRVDEGSKVKIGSIDFEGNQFFDDGKLRSVFKKTKQGGMFCFINKHCVFNDAKFNEDLERLREFYFDRGFINFGVGEPEVRSEGEKSDRRIHIRLSLTEGQQFKVGKVSVEGNTAYPSDALLSLNRLTIGAPFSRKKMNDSRQDMSDIYGIKGYFNVVVVPRFQDTDQPDVVNVVYKITENDTFYLHRLSFKGNTATKDKVIRRQVRMAEGDLFNTALFRRGLFRIYQLGYFDEPKPKIEESPEDPTKLDVTIDLQEQGRNDIRFGGGVSGVEGFFGTLAFSTRNLFGTGNSLTLDLQSGKRVKQYQLSYMNPYLWDKPISGGIDLFNNFVDYQDFERRGTGGVAQMGVSFRDFWFFRTSYRYEDVDQEPSTFTDANGNEIPPTQAEIDLYTDQRTVSSIEPVLSYSSIDNPVRPWKGFRQVVSFEYSGGSLGGTTNLIKPRIDTTAYVPFNKRVNFGVHAEYSFVDGFGGVSVPLFEKFFLGGERSLRGFRAFQVGPRAVDSAGNEVLIGGEKKLVLNAELQFKVADPVSLVLFADVGNAYASDESVNFSTLKKSYGAEIRFWTPLLQAPLRLIWSYVPEPLVRNGVQDPKTDFTFSIGTTF